MMHRIPILALFAAILCAQNPDNPFDRPPANVDRALRERITQFYQFHVGKEYRKAEALVAPDTKEFFYGHNKPAYLSFEIGRIEYSDNYTRAKATVLCEQYVMMPGFADKPIKVPTPSTWKLERGKWYWYVDQNAMRDTPFGRMTAGPASPTGGPLPGAIPSDPAPFLKLVKADKDAVSLKPGQPEQVTIANTAPGIMSVTILGEIPGVEAKLDHSTLQIGDKTVLSLRAKDGAQAGLLNIKVDQTGEIIAIKVDVQNQ
ncbi:MAG TPA: hypothetical protein VE959_37520 [Bryobacteraceae bacterium]|nr:hypothetical protein [Bryobacteraceae bacterium]